MTVSNVTPIIRYPYTGPGSYSFSFLVYDQDDLTITHTDVYGNRTLLSLSTDYTVTLNSGSPGGSVTTTYSETTGFLEIARILEYAQTTNWENEGALDMELLEQDFDKTIMLLQQLKSEFYRAPAQANLRGAWATATDYVQGDVVWDSTDEIFYACYVAHTSGALATDVAAGYWFESLDLTAIYADAINAAVAIATAAKADLASPAFTGVPTVPTASVGTNSTQAASTAFVHANAKPKAIQVFTSSGTYTKTSGATIAIVEVVGGGGGGCGAGPADYAGPGGGAGGYARKKIDLSSVTTETVTIGAGGSAGSTGAGGNGGTSSFGAHCSATGGTGGPDTGSNYSAGGAGGSGSGGDINLTGGRGGSAKVPAGDGGNSVFGGAGCGNYIAAGSAGAAPGAGGGGGYTGQQGGAGAAGIVIVTEY